MTDYTKYKGRDLTLWEKFFPPADYDCGCGADPYCTCGWGGGVVIIIPFIVLAIFGILFIFR